MAVRVFIQVIDYDTGGDHLSLEAIMRTTLVAAIAILTLVLAGCASSRSGQVYSRDQARTSHTVEYGTVTAVTQVQLEGTKSGAGTIVGGAAGGVAGSSIGGGRGAVLGAIAGAAVGALAGSAAEEGITRKNGLEITVQLDSGKVLAVVQEADVQFRTGDRVRVLQDYAGTTRVRY